MNLDVGNAALAAATRARDGLAVPSRADERGMAAVAKSALFCEALLGAIRARIGELRTVAK
jgi:hypothetical protein